MMFGWKNKKGKSQAETEPSGPATEAKIQNAVVAWLGAPAEEVLVDKKPRRPPKQPRAPKGSTSDSGSDQRKTQVKKKGRSHSKPKKDKKEKFEETQLFGVPIEVAARRSDSENGLIPLPLRNGVRFLNEKSLQEEGLYRVPGSHAKYLEYKDLFDAGEDVDFCQVEKIHQNVAMMVLKYLKDLPEPLYTNALTAHIKKTLYGVKDKEKQTRLLRKVMGMLPLVNREVFRFLISHLRVLSEHRTEEHMNASIMSWGISLGRTMGRLMEMLFEGPDDLIPHTIIFGVELEEAAHRSHKKGLIPSPIRFGIDALLRFQLEDEGLAEKMLVEIGDEVIFQSEIRYVLDGGCKTNPFLEHDPSVVFNTLRFYLHEIPGTLFTAELPGLLEPLLPPPGIILDAGVMEKIRYELEQLPIQNYENLKLFAWYFQQLGSLENFTPDKIQIITSRLFEKLSPVFDFIYQNYFSLWPNVDEEGTGEPSIAPSASITKDEVVDSGDEEPDVPEEEYPSEFPNSPEESHLCALDASIPPPLPSELITLADLLRGDAGPLPTPPPAPAAGKGEVEDGEDVDGEDDESEESEEEEDVKEGLKEKEKEKEEELSSTEESSTEESEEEGSEEELSPVLDLRVTTSGTKASPRPSPRASSSSSSQVDGEEKQQQKPEVVLGYIPEEGYARDEGEEISKTTKREGKEEGVEVEVEEEEEDGVEAELAGLQLPNLPKGAEVDRNSPLPPPLVLSPQTGRKPKGESDSFDLEAPGSGLRIEREEEDEGGGIMKSPKESWVPKSPEVPRCTNLLDREVVLTRSQDSAVPQSPRKGGKEGGREEEEGGRGGGGGGGGGKRGGKSSPKEIPPLLGKTSQTWRRSSHDQRESGVGGSGGVGDGGSFDGSKEGGGGGSGVLRTSGVLPVGRPPKLIGVRKDDSMNDVNDRDDE